MAFCHHSMGVLKLNLEGQSSDMERICENIQYAVEGRRSAVVVQLNGGIGDIGLSP